jgi:hypothetical protein
MRAPRDRSAIYFSQHRGRPESLDDQVDTERQLPEGLRNRRDALHGAPALDDVEHDGDARGGDQWTAVQSEAFSGVLVWFSRGLMRNTKTGFHAMNVALK